MVSDVRVWAVDLAPEWWKEGPTPEGWANVVLVSFEVTAKQAFLVSLAKSRNCHLALTPHCAGQGADANYDINAVIERLIAPEVAPAPRLVKRR